MNTNYHKWSIDDVKYGDILVSEYDAIFMANGKIESLDNSKTGPDYICALSADGDFYTIYDPFFDPFDDESKPIPFTTSSRPATYEERVKLFKSIADNHWKLCIDNMGNITGIEKIAEEPLEAVPIMPEESDIPLDEIEAVSKDFQSSSEQFEPTKRIDKHNFDGKEDFHGNRDFYHLVKNSSRNIIEREKKNQLNNDTLIESALDSIERNFSGIQFKDKTSLEVFKGIFKEMYPCPVIKEYDVLKRIKENINDIYSRYLLVVSKSSISTFLLSSILSDKEKDYSFYIGSQFEQDLNTEEYVLKVLNKIQSYMERGNILILKNLDPIYYNNICMFLSLFV